MFARPYCEPDLPKVRNTNIGPANNKRRKLADEYSRATGEKLMEAARQHGGMLHIEYAEWLNDNNWPTRRGGGAGLRRKSAGSSEDSGYKSQPSGLEGYGDVTQVSPHGGKKRSKQPPDAESVRNNRERGYDSPRREQCREQPKKDGFNP